MSKRHATADSRFYLVGGGIASMAAAVFLIRDGGVDGSRITILEETVRSGGSLDAAGGAEHGYLMRGGRMLESKYVCTFDLFSGIPTLDGLNTVTKEIFEWNDVLETSSKSRLFRDGKAVDNPSFGLSERHIATIERLEAEPEVLLHASSIADHFDEAFFMTDFWFMWCSTFAFQPWHSAVEFKRYLARFSHMISGFSTLHGIMRTVYNQYDSMVRPLLTWLETRGVVFQYGTRVTDLYIHHDPSDYVIREIFCEEDSQMKEIRLGEADFVLVTLGSMTEGSSFGSKNVPPEVKGKADGGAWRLWETLAARQSDFGHPANFTNRIDQSKWVSFTTTMRNPEFFKRIQELTGNIPGQGGLITFPDSNWLLSIVLPHQPHFIDQPADVDVFWGYGLNVDRPGNFVKFPMTSCSGSQIMNELFGHLAIDPHYGETMKDSTCISCMMPFITSQFLTRTISDRPKVIPALSRNLAFIGQFCEMPDDVVFTIEYSIRSAQTAVYGLLGLDRQPPPVYKGLHSPRVAFQAFLALHDIGKSESASAT